MLAILLAVVRCAGPRFCCLDFDAGSDAAAYCDNHRDAVGLFIMEASSREQQSYRLDAFKHYLAAVSCCKTVACLESTLEATPELKEFFPLYQQEHNFAEQETTVPEEQKAALILCGFRDAVRRYENLLDKGLIQ